MTLGICDIGGEVGFLDYLLSFQHQLERAIDKETGSLIEGTTGHSAAFGGSEQVQSKIPLMLGLKPKSGPFL